MNKKTLNQAVELFVDRYKSGDKRVTYDELQDLIGNYRDTVDTYVEKIQPIRNRLEEEGLFIRVDAQHDYEVESIDAERKRILELRKKNGSAWRVDKNRIPPTKVEDDNAN